MSKKDSAHTWANGARDALQQLKLRARCRHGSEIHTHTYNAAALGLQCGGEPFDESVLCASFPPLFIHCRCESTTQSS